MPGRRAGHPRLPFKIKGVDGQDKPGHDLLNVENNIGT
jgi:hypothetical protein